MTATFLYLSIAVVGLALLILGLRAYLPPHSEETPSSDPDDEPGSRRARPMTPLQQRAWWGLGICVFVSLVVTAVLAWRGASAFIDDPGTNRLIEGLLIAGVLAYVIVMRRTRGGGRKLGSVMDERDRLIRAQAPELQSVAMFLTLAIWAIVLTEAYWDRGAIPVAFAYLVFWSTFFIGHIGLSIGILLGYAGWESHGEG